MPPKRRHLPPHLERQSYARAEPVEIPPGAVGLGDSFLIVCEGEVTEPRYLESLRDLLQMSTIDVRVIHPPFTDALGLVHFAIEERKRFSEAARGHRLGNAGFAGYDHVWVVFDADNAQSHGHLGRATELARTEGVHMAPSTPCFEFWLLVHFRLTTAPLLSSRDVESAVRDELGFRYEKSREAFPRIWSSLKPRICDALANAKFVRSHHELAGTPRPANPSTDLDRLVHSLNLAVRPEMRLRRHVSNV